MTHESNQQVDHISEIQAAIEQQRIGKERQQAAMSNLHGQAMEKVRETFVRIFGSQILLPKPNRLVIERTGTSVRIDFETSNNPHLLIKRTIDNITGIMFAGYEVIRPEGISLQARIPLSQLSSTGIEKLMLNSDISYP